MIKMLWVGNTARCDRTQAGSLCYIGFPDYYSAISEPFWKLIAAAARAGEATAQREWQAIDKSMIKVEAACDLGNRIKRALVRRRVRSE